VAETNLRAFNRELTTLAKRLPAESVKVLQRKIVLEALSRIVLKTPVDTGRARGNWQTTVNTSPDDEKLSSDPVADGLGAIAKVPDFAIVYITNNVPYIVYLESGTVSKQAPQGMVAITVEELRGMFQ